MQHVQVVGAAGPVGREVAAALLAAGHPPGNLALYSTPGGPPAGALSWRGQPLTIHPLTAAPPRADLAFLCTGPDEGRAWAPLLNAAGTRVVDLSGGNRWRADVPMVVPGAGPAELGAFTTHVTLPGRSACVLARPLVVLERTAGLEELVCTLFLAQPEPKAGATLVPSTGSPLQGGSCAAEAELAADLRQLLGRPDLPAEVSGVHVGLGRCDAFAVHLRLRQPLTPVEVARALEAAPGVRVEPAAEGPSPEAAVGGGEVLVGRIRAGSRGPASLCFFAVGDQLRLGAALAALEVAAGLPACA